ncbi:large ribosomal subunit protein uL14 [Candidatus Nesciobacter abundans]|uniref:Large ribosomal subunit protein uL14 n=1 Tax=Candidatus Nesciobacter abundans TaxID=2601668 RepID=A0A5C0UGW9_9PROT|nr:uL14 family ribosomal protein [Candidatus Nesciobacter abundans]QEK38911.1 uL14 family ribosomal protein [Candidatus Nesciobacter abundans]
MLPKGARLKVADNSGAKEVECIGLPSSKKHGASVGDVIRISVKKANPQAKLVSKGKVCHGVVVSTASHMRQKGGIMSKSDSNFIVLVDEKGEMIGNRVLNPVSRIIKDKYPKIVSLAPEVF